MEIREKLRRFLRTYAITQEQADEIGKVGGGRTFSFLSGRSQKINRAADEPEVLAYLTNLANHVGQPVAWFLDGKDDFPGGTQPSIEVADDAIPIYGYLPRGPNEVEGVIGSIVHTRPPNIREARFYILAEARIPYFQKGDEVLVGSSDVIRSGVITLAESVADGSRDIWSVERRPEGYTLKELAENDLRPPEKWRPLGHVIEVRRVMTHGLVVTHQCDTGLTPEMLAV